MKTIVLPKLQMEKNLTEFCKRNHSYRQQHHNLQATTFTTLATASQTQSHATTCQAQPSISLPQAAVPVRSFDMFLDVSRKDLSLQAMPPVRPAPNAKVQVVHHKPKNVTDPLKLIERPTKSAVKQALSAINDEC